MFISFIFLIHAHSLYGCVDSVLQPVFYVPFASCWFCCCSCRFLFTVVVVVVWVCRVVFARCVAPYCAASALLLYYDCFVLDFFCCIFLFFLFYLFDVVGVTRVVLVW